MSSLNQPPCPAYRRFRDVPSFFLLTCEFRGRAWRVVLNVGFLRVCPIQPKFSLICMPIGSCHALFPKFFICDPFRPSDVEQAPETYIVKCLDLLESRFAHSLCSTPYNMADFILELSIRCLVVVQMFLQAKMFYRIVNAVSVTGLFLPETYQNCCQRIQKHEKWDSTWCFVRCKLCIQKQDIAFLIT